MKKYIYNFLYTILAIILLFDITSPNIKNKNVYYCGVNGENIYKGAKNSWGLIKSCTQKSPEGEQIINDINIGKFKKVKKIDFFLASKFLVKGLESINSADEIAPKIQEYLAKTKANSNGVKVIRCLKKDENIVRMYLYDNNEEKINKLIIGTKESIRLANYDIASMQENYYTGNDGIEYITFKIPKKPQYILNGESQNRVYECMIFNLPKDQHGNWERFRAFLIDLFTRPGQLWDEIMFHKELAQLNIQQRDINEIEEYVFAQLKYNTNDKLYKQSISA